MNAMTSLTTVRSSGNLVVEAIVIVRPIIVWS